MPEAVCKKKCTLGRHLYKPGDKIQVEEGEEISPYFELVKVPKAVKPDLKDKTKNKEEL